MAARFSAGGEALDIGTGTAPDGGTDRRVFRLDGAAPRSQSEIGARLAAVWLTPQMDRLFQEGASGRRRFLDRLVFALEPTHARIIAAHDAAVAGRNRLLAEGEADPAWLAGLEDSIARHAVAATVARMGLIARLNVVSGEGAMGGFPPARIGLLCPIAERLAGAPALQVEDWLRGALAAARPADAGTTGFGAHRADMTLEDAETALPAALASTGQQKALLIGVVLAHALLIAPRPRFFPVAAARRTCGAPRCRPPRGAVPGTERNPGSGAADRHRRRDLPAAQRRGGRVGGGRRRAAGGRKVYASQPYV